MLVNVYVETFKIDAMVFVGKVTMYLTSHRSTIFSSLWQWHDGCYICSRKCISFRSTRVHSCFHWVRVARVSVLCFIDRCLSTCHFSFGHCVVCPSIYGFRLLLWCLQTFPTLWNQRKMSWDQRKMSWDQRKMSWHQREMSWDQRKMSWDKRKMSWDQRKMLWNQRKMSCDQRKMSWDQRKISKLAIKVNIFNINSI